jgi:hypothetical protein
MSDIGADGSMLSSVLFKFLIEADYLPPNKGMGR